MLKDQIQKDYISAFKAKNRLAMETLGMLKSAIQYVEVEAKAKDIELNEQDLIKIIQAEAKKRKEAIDSFTKAGRLESVEEEKKQLDILSAYLPEPMNQDDIKAIILTAIASVSASGMDDFGKVMKLVSQELKGKADGGLIKTMVEELLKK